MLIAASVGRSRYRVGLHVPSPRYQQVANETREHASSLLSFITYNWTFEITDNSTVTSVAYMTCNNILESRTLCNFIVVCVLLHVGLINHFWAFFYTRTYNTSKSYWSYNNLYFYLQYALWGKCVTRRDESWYCHYWFMKSTPKLLK